MPQMLPTRVQRAPAMSQTAAQGTEAPVAVDPPRSFQRQIDLVRATLCRDYPDREPRAVDEALARALELVYNARIHEYRLVLVEKQARRELRSMRGSSPSSAEPR